MFLLLAGVGVLVVTVALFIWMLPRGGKRHRFVDTELEPYVGVAFTAATALGFTMTLSGLMSLIASS
jgi:hypothetical protein